MNYKTDLDVNKLNAKFDQRAKKAQKFIDSQVLKDSDPLVPKRVGKLIQSGISGTVLGEGQVIYNSLYARAMYYGDFVFNGAPERGNQWFEKSKALHKKTWLDGATIIMKGG